MQLLAVQFNIVWEDPPANHRQVEAMLAQTTVEPGALIVLPEMFATGFSMNVAAVAEQDRGPTEPFLRELAQRHRACVLAGVVHTDEHHPGHGSNQAVAYDPHGQRLVRYRKVHPFSLGKEHEHYRPGRRIETFPWGEMTVAPLICYDLRFPEPFRAAAVQGAELFAVIANWPSSRVEHWTTLLKARAIENQAYVVGVNRCGHDPSLAYPGRSLIVGPAGEVLAEGDDQPRVLEARVDPQAVRTYREKFPALRDRRRDLWPLPHESAEAIEYGQGP